MENGKIFRFQHIGSQIGMVKGVLSIDIGVPFIKGILFSEMAALLFLRFPVKAPA